MMTKTNGAAAHEPLKASVERAVGQFLEELEGQPIKDLYDLVIQEVEAPLLAIVMAHTARNQTQAAYMLGLSRGTLRKKLKVYGLL